MEPGSTGTCRDNLFFAVDTDPSFVFWEPQGLGTVLPHWTLANNTLRKCTDLRAAMAPTPAVGAIVYDAAGAAHVTLQPRHADKNITDILYTLDGSWPRAEGNPSTHVLRTQVINHQFVNGTIVVPRTAALNVRYSFHGLLDSLTMTLVVPVGDPAA